MALFTSPLIKGVVNFANGKFGQKERALVRTPSLFVLVFEELVIIVIPNPTIDPY